MLKGISLLKLRYMLIIPVALGAFLALQGCANNMGATADGEGGAGGVGAGAGAPVQISATSLEGEEWSLEDHRGKVVLVNFWATWCPPCRAETPDLVELAGEYEDKGVEFVGISLDRDGPEGVRRFVKDYNIPYPILMPGTDSEIPFDVEAIPTTYIIDREGNVVETYVGARPKSEFAAGIDAALAQG